MYRTMFAVVALAAAQVSAVQASGMEPSGMEPSGTQTSGTQPSNARLPSNPAAVSTHFAWADVLRVEPVYAMVAVQQPGCHGELGGISASNSMPTNENPSTSELERAVPVESTRHVDAGEALNAPPSATPRMACLDNARVYQEQRIDGYDVEYRYRGEVYLSRLTYDPGERLRVRVSVSPAN